MYNSCVDRHCLQCGGARRAKWLEKTEQLIFPKVNYFQVVFTLPAELSGLILGNRGALYNLLSQAAWQALDKTLREMGQFQTAAHLVLHTWNQRLDHHPHIHALVPGGGPSLDGKRWVTMESVREQSRPSWKQVFERGIYADPSLYSPMFHICQRIPLAYPIDKYG